MNYNPLKVSLENIIPLTEARDHFSKIVNEVQKDKLYVLTKGGKPAVAIVDVKYLETITGGEVQQNHIQQEINKNPEKVGITRMIEHKPLNNNNPIGDKVPVPPLNDFTPKADNSKTMPVQSPLITPRDIQSKPSVSPTPPASKPVTPPPTDTPKPFTPPLPSTPPSHPAPQTPPPPPAPVKPQESPIIETSLNNPHPPQNAQNLTPSNNPAPNSTNDSAAIPVKVNQNTPLPKNNDTIDIISSNYDQGEENENPINRENPDDAEGPAQYGGEKDSSTNKNTSGDPDDMMID